MEMCKGKCKPNAEIRHPKIKITTTTKTETYKDSHTELNEMLITHIKHTMKPTYI